MLGFRQTELVTLNSFLQVWVKFSRLPFLRMTDDEFSLEFPVEILLDPVGSSERVWSDSSVACERGTSLLKRIVCHSLRSIFREHLLLLQINRNIRMLFNLLCILMKNVNWLISNYHIANLILNLTNKINSRIPGKFLFNPILLELLGVVDPLPETQSSPALFWPEVTEILPECILMCRFRLTFLSAE